MKSPIIKQILNFGITTAVISLLLACIGFSILEFHSIKNEASVKLNSQMQILAYNLQPTLVFDDKDSADKILRSLQDDKSISKITVYKASGGVFTTFTGNNKRGDIKLIKNIFFEKKLVGSIEIEGIYVGVVERYGSYFLISLLIIIISIPASYLISAPIRGQVSQAVLQLEDQSNRLRMLADQLVTTEQRERKRIAALIHDHLQQLLVASKLQLGLTLKAMEKQDLDKAIVSLKRADEFINESTRSARTLTVELRPPVLYEDGIVPALQWLANKFKNDHDFDIVLHLDEIPTTLPDSLKIMIFESVKEVLFNAVKYSGVFAVDLFLKYDHEQICITVKDRGVGFDVKHLERKTIDKGFGLFGIRERLKLLNGSLQITSRKGEGTQVEIQVPLSLKSGANQSSSGAIEKISMQESQKKNKSIRILLVDDHKIVREGIANLLKENRMLNVIAQAENGVEAVEKAEAFMPDIIIMDINMPQLNGIEATRVIKKKFPQINVIGLSVQDENDVADSMKKAGAVTLVNKAGDPQNLIETILAVSAIK